MANTEQQLSVLSLFAGIGGIDLGLERAGMRVVAHSEIDPYACKVLAKHWPNVPNLGDITKCTWGRFDRAAMGGQPIDVIAGGFPCQDISYAGLGAGIQEGTRSGLWYEYARAIRDLRPRYVIVENVSALLSRGLDIVLGDLAALGFDAKWDCIPAAAVGAPHLRDRVFVIGSRADVGTPRWDLGPMAYASSQRRWEVAESAPSHEGSDGWRAEADHLARSAESTSANAGSVEHEGHRDAFGIEGAEGVHGRPASHWSTEPRVGRVAPRIPHRVDRLRCLGNAVVPQVAQYIGEIVVAHHESQVLAS